MTESYGSNSTIIARQEAAPADFGFETDADRDAFLDTLREQASSEVVEHCDRVFSLVEGQSELVYGTGRETFRVDHYPVRNISELKVGGRSLTKGKDYRVKTPAGRPDTNAGVIQKLGSRHRRRWPRGKEIEVTYDWGYETTPPVVDRVVEDMVVEALEKADADRSSSAKSSESMDGYSVSWDNSDVSDYMTLDESKRNRLEGLRRRGTA